MRASGAPLPVNAWYQIPGTTLNGGLGTADASLMAARGIPGSGQTYTTGGNNIYAFSGGTLRRRDSVLMLHGGGGNDGFSNAILGLRLSANTPQWEVIMPATARADCLPNDGDGNYNPAIHNIDRAYNYNASVVESSPRSPLSVHSYTHTQYLDSRDCWVRVGATKVWPTDGGTFDYLDAFYWSETGKADKTARQWSTQAFQTVTRTLADGRHVFKHPWTEDLYAGGGYYLMKWTPAANAWATLAGSPTWLDPQIQVPFGVDPIQNCVLVPWSTQHGTRGHIIDCDTGAVVTLAAGDWLGDTASYSFGDVSSIVWCEDWQCLVVIASSGWDLLKVQINRATNKVTLTKVTISEYSTGHRPTTLPVAIGGTNNRLQYAPELHGLVFAHYGDRGVYFIRTAQGQ
jgi:hypothetical protein